jgi:hypothetical protein
MLACATLFLGRSLVAQTTSTLTGTVTTAGQPLAGVTVTISSPALQGTRTTESGSTGAYELATLPPGEYRVVFERNGFASARSEATLRLSQVTRVDAAMRAAGGGETVVVRAAAPSVLERPQVSTSLPLEQIERLPIQRNQLATAQFAPGVSGNTFSNGQLQISGGPGYDNLVLVNGVVVNENTRGQMRPMYVEDAILETTLLTGAISAEYGRFSGGVVNTITKSGGNELSASLRDNLSSPRWSAQSPAGETRESTLNHVWEATLGGYVLRDRLWFFTSGRWAKNDTVRQTVAVPASTAAPASPASPVVSYAEGNDQKRWEGKLTALLGARQTLAASYFGVQTDGTNVRFNPNFYDTESLTTRDDPESLLALHYDGLVLPKVLVEGRYSARRFADRTGATATDLVNGTILLDRANSNTRFHSPTLCGVCDAEHRDNDDGQLLARAFVDQGRLGAHDLVAGVDRFTERRHANNHQSGSDFSLFVTRAQYLNGAIYPVVTPSNANGGGTFIRWSPILTPSADDELRTDSVFVNDVWSPARRWQLSLGVRWDRNHARDSDGTVVSDDRRFSPRLSVQYDLSGDGRRRLSASFADYSSRIADSIAASNQAAGNAAAIDFAYRGPAINATALNTPMADVIRMVFDYFNTTQGGTANRTPINLRANGSRTIPGYTSYFDGSLASPYVRELTLGYGAELGLHGYVRADLIHRDWHAFYASSVTTATRRVSTPLGIPVDLALIRNSENIERHYRGLQLQSRWTPGRFESGIHYTWATLRGNDEAENANGPLTNIDPSLYYPEFFAYDRAAPIGDLPGDQRHRLQAWAGYQTTLGAVRLSGTLLQSYGSGLPYAIAAPINLTRYTGAPANPGYNSIPNGNYYFSGRGELRTAGIQSTDVALRSALRIGPVEWFVHGDVLNLFNRAGIADPTRLNLSVTTAATSTTFQPFDPAKQVPIECPRGAAASVCTAMGANYQLAPTFGQPLNNQAYQLPRTWRFSVGARF